MPNPDGTFTPRKGRYYFLEPGCEFLPRSMLGGHWFEEKPYQTGPYSTLPSPKPVWVNGSTTFPAGWPDVHCCCGIWPEFTPTRARITVTIPGHPTFEADADVIGSVFGTIIAQWHFVAFGYRYSIFLGCDPCAVTITSYPCNVAGSILFPFVELDQGDGYVVTVEGSGLTLSENTSGLCFAGCSVLARFYGTPIP